MGFDLLREHAFDILSGLGLLIAGWWFGRWRMTREWRSQEFLSRLQISLTLIRDGRLTIRTLGERPCVDVFGNAEAARTVADAARQTAADDPILNLPRDSYWSFLNSLVNELSSLCASGYIAADLGAPVHRDIYIACLTCERTADIRTRKVRALVIRKNLLLNLPDTMPGLTREQDIVRWATLRSLAAAHSRTPWRFVELELAG